ncbi:imidazole glycerol phosphate synthase subunit HisH [Ponticaulis sp.]|mgnify:CR=1 FL=1|uniref:imidazole glycerol phosphate synthase subunit HisH n=1 Tax=Ponticaulis sp. TaxID=2020902 RepID=UPI000C47E297|nr:imidazole glycerol phosphate synthase subunit HisH [Ponticaulis sp.]MBN03256.1 imidazole glycerol phosphate synthase subunit HisH [Ponticaulis sp.]|tara:strand:- start:373 stop:1014 length:642 start_codon:yes stop_codon:yes gene_type:complete
MQTVALIDYGAGNIPSAQRALEVAVERSGLSCELIVTDSPEKIAAADRVVIPGVGHFKDCREAMFGVSGLVEALEDSIHKKGRPVLGICVGMQLMADLGLEDGETPGFGWIPGKVEHIPTDAGLPIPHMGWNELVVRTEHPVLEGIQTGNHAYFVHSYHMHCENPSDLQVEVDYGGHITAAIGRDNVFGTQFHPELSQETGLRLLTNWIKWNP